MSELNDILDALNKINARLDKIEGKAEQPKEKQFEGIKVYVTTEELPADEDKEAKLPPLWGWEVHLIVPGRPTTSQKGACSSENNQKALISGLYVGLHQCWLHPASKKGLRIILNDSTLVALLKSRVTLEGAPYNDQDLSERFLAIVGFLQIFPEVSIEQQ